MQPIILAQTPRAADATPLVRSRWDCPPLPTYCAFGLGGSFVPYLPCNARWLAG